jgi:hypothetical protein
LGTRTIPVSRATARANCFATALGAKIVSKTSQVTVLKRGKLPIKNIAALNIHIHIHINEVKVKVKVNEIDSVRSSRVNSEYASDGSLFHQS